MSVEFVSLHVLVFSEVEDYKKIFCFIIFRANGHFWLVCGFLHCLVVIATTSSIFTPNVENVTSNKYFETPCGFKGFILPEVI